ncbi:RHS repeat domain-containing protein, partial [Paenibacillus ehimensis]|uniref:RHS repeat domain-containing protein n=1 Tax=Paenibacillus ehimensis TaxID=79264 RepID=UPI001FEB4CBC
MHPDPLGGVVQYEYNELGELLSETDEEGRVTRLVYDGQDNLIEVTLPDGTSGKWTYNHRGACLQETNP